MEQSVTNLLKKYGHTKFGQLFADYIECSDMAPSSEAIRGRAAMYFCDQYGGGALLEDPERIGYGQAEDFRNALAKTRSKTTANIYFANLKSFFSWLASRGHIERDPFKDVRRFTVEQTHTKPYSDAEIARILMIANARV